MRWAWRWVTVWAERWWFRPQQWVGREGQEPPREHWRTLRRLEHVRRLRAERAERAEQLVRELQAGKVPGPETTALYDELVTQDPTAARETRAAVGKALAAYAREYREAVADCHALRTMLVTGALPDNDATRWRLSELWREVRESGRRRGGAGGRW